MDSQQNIEARWDLVTRRLPEITHGDEIRQMMADGKTPRTFWATAPTGRPHIAYFVPMTKMAEFVKAGVHATVLYCDLYAYLVNYDAPFETVRWRTRYYRHLIRAMLTTLGVPKTSVDFVDGSSYELTPRFNMDNYRLTTLVRQDEARVTSEEYGKTDQLCLLLCPGLPGLGEEYLSSDFQFGGEDQRGLFEFNERVLPQLGYRRRAHMMNAMVPGLAGPKMSSSIKNSKIELLDPPAVVVDKFELAACPPGAVDGNGVLSMLKHILMPMLEFRSENLRGGFNEFVHVSADGPLNGHYAPGANGHVDSHVNGHVNGHTNGHVNGHVNGDKPNGHTNGETNGHTNGHTIAPSTFDVPGADPPRSYSTYAAIEADFVAGILTPGVLKAAAAAATNAFLQPLRDMYAADAEWQEVDRMAYGSVQL